MIKASDMNKITKKSMDRVAYSDETKLNSRRNQKKLDRIMKKIERRAKNGYFITDFWYVPDCILYYLIDNGYEVYGTVGSNFDYTVSWGDK